MGVDGSYASNVPAFLTKLWTLVEDPDTNHLICWSAVSIVKTEETKVRQEDLSKLLYEVQLLRTQQDNMECQMQDMKQQNEVLWREVVSLRQNHSQQQKVMNKLIQFLFSQMQPTSPNSVSLKRKLPLMLDDGSPGNPASKFSHSHHVERINESFYIESPPGDSGACSANGMSGGPIISDVTEMSQTPLTMHMQTDETREKCMMLIKEEPVSPAMRGGVKAGPTGGDPTGLSPCEVCPAEPPVLPVALVQSVLEGRGSSGPLGDRRSKRMASERGEVSEAVENVDMSLEELQLLLLRSHQHSSVEAGGSAAVDPFTLSLPLTEWNFNEMDPNLKSYMFQNQEAEAFPANECEEQ
uniref:Vertebrate heat shock transcription factor C-terminal domain-containing protein n=1 Tax=Knipowitschia caucasica TaxID=637954 RepID=A0AAV2KZ06_KNICA